MLYVGATGINATGSTGWNSNNYTLAQWIEMEAAGAVFLPAASNRWGTVIDNVGNGYYWSSSPYYVSVSYASSVYFSSDDFGTASGRYRNNGFSVRPVWDND